MNQRIFAILLTLALLLGLCPLSVWAVEAEAVPAVELEKEAEAENVKLMNATGNWISVTGIENGQICFDSSTGTITDCETSVTVANIPEKINGVSVTSIGYRAFYKCTSLTSITIPNSITSIEDGEFYCCSSLTSIQVASENPNYSDLNGTLFNKSQTVLVAYPAGKSATIYSIPNSVTSIGNEAFISCTSLTSITIPNSVTSIGDRMFEVCTSLMGITIPNSVTSIGDSAFYYCTSLASITIPNSVTSIEGCAFDACRNLTSITIPNGVTSIGKYAFYKCKGLKDVYYTGTESQWKAMSIGNYNDCLTSATIHYNSRGGEDSPFVPLPDPEPDETPQVSKDSYYGTPVKKYFRIHATDATGYPYPAGFDIQVGTEHYSSGKTQSASATDDIEVPIPETYTGDIIIAKDGYYSYAMPSRFLDSSNYIVMTPKSVTTPFAQTLLADESRGSRQEYSNLLFGEPITIDALGLEEQSEVENLYVSINWNGHGEGTVWLEQGENSVPLINNEFNSIRLANFFVSGQKIFLCAKAGDGTMFKTVTKITVVAQATTELNLDTGDALDISVDDSNEEAGFLLGESLGIDFSKLTKNVPIKFNIKKDGSVEGVIGLKALDQKDSESAFGDIKEAFSQLGTDDTTKSTEVIKEIKAAGYDFLLQPHSSIGVSGNAGVMGYFTGNVLDGRLGLTEVNLVAFFEGKVSYTHQTIVMNIPAYIKFSVGAKLEYAFKQVYDEVQEKMVADGETPLQFSVPITAETGPGWEGYLSCGVQGKATFKVYTDIPMKKEDSSATLQGTLSLVGSLGGVSGSWKLYQTEEMVFWDAGSCVWYEKGSGDTTLCFVPDTQKSVMLFSAESSNGNAIAEGVSGYYAPCLTRLPNGNLLAVWVADVPGRSLLDRGGLYYSVLSDGAWSSPQLVWDDNTNDFSPNLYRKGNTIYLMWQNYTEVYGKDSFSDVNAEDVSKNCDIAIAKFDADSGKFLSQTAFSHAGYDYHPEMTLDGDTPVLAWTNGEDVISSTLQDAAWTEPAVCSDADWYTQEEAAPSSYTEEVPATTTTRQYFSTADYQAILYTEADENGHNQIFGLFNDGYGWGSPIQLTELSEQSIGGFQAVMNGTQVSVLATACEINENGVCVNADLLYLDHHLDTDLCVSDADYVRETFQAGNEVTFQATVTNNSAKTVQGVEVSLWNGDDCLTSSEFGLTLLPGDSKTAYINYPLPADFSLNQVKIQVTPSEATDGNMEDNSSVCNIHRMDLSVESVSAVKSQTGTTVLTQIVNRGSIASGEFTLTIHKGTPNGDVIGTEKLSSMAPADSVYISTEIEEDLPDGEMIYVEVEKLEGENLYGNNSSQALLLSEETGGVQLDVSDSTEGDTLRLSVSVSNYTDKAINGKLIFATYDKNGKMEAVKATESFQVETMQSEGKTIDFENTTEDMTWKVFLMDQDTSAPLSESVSG